DEAAGAVAREQGVLREAVIGHGAMAEPLLRHEGRAEPPPLGHAEVADGPAVDGDNIGPMGEALAGKSREKLALTVPGNAGDAEDLARPHGEVDVPQRLAVRLLRRERQAAHD